MKKYINCKILLSVLLVCVMLLPSVSAYYSSMALAMNNTPSVIRYPMHNGTNISLKGIKRELYYLRYKHFFLECPQACPEESEYLVARTSLAIYEQEAKHIGACAYATALFLGGDNSEALKFSAGIVKLCNLIVSYPKCFNKRLLLFVTNYAYALLGNLFKEGSHDDLNAHGVSRFSDDACRCSSTYCVIGGESIESSVIISPDIIASYMTVFE